MGDVVRAKGDVKNAKGVFGWAVHKINEYNYRKTFGLSYEQMMEEPLDSVIINNEIMKAVNQKEKDEHRKLKRKR